MNGNLDSGIYPNKFYFAVPFDLVAYTEKMLTNSAYGVISMSPIDAFGPQIIVYKKAGLLRKEPCPDNELWEFCKRVSMESIDLRERLYYFNLNNHATTSITKEQAT